MQCLFCGFEGRFEVASAMRRSRLLTDLITRELIVVFLFPRYDCPWFTYHPCGEL